MAHTALHMPAGHADYSLSAVGFGQDRAADGTSGSQDNYDQTGQCSDENGEQSTCCGMPCHSAAMPFDYERVGVDFKTEAAVIAVLESAVGSSPSLLERPPRASRSFLG